MNSIFQIFALRKQDTFRSAKYAPFSEVLGGNHPLVSRFGMIAFWRYSHDIKAGTSHLMWR